MQCSLCNGPLDKHRHPATGEVYWAKGHNAEPISDGRCGDLCNDLTVIPARIKRLQFSSDAATKAMTSLIKASRRVTLGTLFDQGDYPTQCSGSASRSDETFKHHQARKVQ